MEKKLIQIEYRGQTITTVQECIDLAKEEYGLDLIEEMKKVIDKEME